MLTKTKHPIKEARVLGYPKIELSKLAFIVPGEKLPKNFDKIGIVLIPERKVMFIIPRKIQVVNTQDKILKKEKNIDLNFSLIEKIIPITKNNKTKKTLER